MQMIILDATTDKLEVVLGGAITTNQLRCITSRRDITTTGYTPGGTEINTNGNTDVTIVGSPGASTQRVVDFVNVYNHDTVLANVTIKFDANGTEYILFKGDLGTQERLEYSDGEGFRVFTSSGALKTNVNGSNNPTSSSITTVVLGSDVADSSGANTYTNVTGLTFTPVNGATYWFRAVINYTAAAGGTGSMWSCNGPTTSMLSYYSRYSLTTSSETLNHGVTAYDSPATSNATSAGTSGNIAVLEGFFTATSTTAFIIRMGTEVDTSAITAKAGSILQYQQVL